MAQIISMPKLSPTMTEGVLARWHKKVGDKVEPGELLFEVATDKATIEYNALDGGFLRVIQVAENGKAEVGQPLAVLTDTPNEPFSVTERALSPEKTEPQKPTPRAPAPAPETVSRAMETVTEPLQPVVSQQPQGYFPPAESKAATRASPYARKLAKQKGISLEGVIGSGPNKMVMSRDLELISSQHMVQKPSQTVTKNTHVDEISLTPMRKAIGERLSYSKSTIPHFYCKQDINVTALLQLREQLKQVNIPVTVNDLIVRATALAMKEHPVLRSTFDEKQKVIRRYPHADISIAVTIPGGLITPIVFAADLLSLQEISKMIKTLAEKARNNKLQPNEYQGGCLTISNLGMYGVPEFSAIVNPPQAAILAVGAAQPKPVIENGIITAGQVMTITLSCDHRVVDGADAAQFLKTLKELLERPLRLVL